MLIMLNDKEERPDDFFLYAQCDETLVMFGFTMDPNFSDNEVDDIDGAPQKCLPPSFGKIMNISEITSILEVMKPTAILELEEEITKLRKHITNDKFPYTHQNGNTYLVMCGEGEHRDLIKGARRKAEREPEYSHFWSMFDTDEKMHLVPMTNSDLIDLANAWEDWGGSVFEHAEMMKMTLPTLRYEQIKNFDVDFTMLTGL